MPLGQLLENMSRVFCCTQMLCVNLPWATGCMLYEQSVVLDRSLARSMFLGQVVL